MKQSSELCRFCSNGATCALKGCHGSKFDLCDKLSKQGNYNPLKADAYIPQGSERAFLLLMGASAALNPVTSKQNGQLHQLAALVEYKGNPPRRCFKSWGLYLVDYGSVTDKTADIAIIKCFYFFGSCGSTIKQALTGPRKYRLDSASIFVADPSKVSMA